MRILSNIADGCKALPIMVGIFAALSFVTPGAFAQSSAHDQAADALYDEGQALLEAGNLKAGCAKFQASLALSPAASTMIKIARCHEEEGKLATAWADYRQALRLNGDTPGVERRKALEDLATQGIGALAPRLPKLRIRVRSAPADVQARSDDLVLPAAVLDEALPADPGPHVVRVGAPGYREETRSVTLEEGKTTVVEFELQKGSVSSSTAGWSRPAGVALVSLGGVGIGLGAVTGLLSLGKVSSLRSSCPAFPHCPVDDTAGKATLNSALSLGNASTAGFIVGGVFAAAGIAFLVIGPGGGGKPDTVDARGSAIAGSVRVSVGPGRFDITGRF